MVGMEPSQKMMRRKASGYAVCVGTTSRHLREGYTPKDNEQEVLMDLCSEVRDSINWGSHTYGGYLYLGQITKGDIKEVRLPKLSVVDSIFDTAPMDTVDIPDAYKTKNAIMSEVRAGIMKPEHAVRLIYGEVADTLEHADYELIRHEIAKESPYYVASAKVRELLFIRSAMAQGNPESVATALAKAKRKDFKAEKDAEEAKVKKLKQAESDYAKSYSDTKMYSVWDWDCYCDLSIGGNPVVFFKREEAEAFLALVKSGAIKVDERKPCLTKDEYEATHTRDDVSISERMNEDDLVSIRGYRRSYGK